MASPPLQTLPNAPPILQQLSRLFQAQAPCLRIDVPDEEPAGQADHGVDHKRPRRTQDVQHGQKGHADDEIRAPIRRRGQARAQTSDIQGKKLRLLPWNIAKPHGVGRDVQDDVRQDEQGRPALRPGHLGGAVWRGGGVGRVGIGGEDDVAEGDGAAEEGEGHDGDGSEEDAAAADEVNEQERKEGEGEVRRGDGERCQGRGGEADQGEDRGGEVH